jgi:hypothetical protein
MKHALFLLLLLPGLALAEYSFTFTWTDPVARTDGSALNPATDLSGYRLQCSGPENAERIVDRAATSAVGSERQYQWTDAVVARGKYDCRMTAIDIEDRESAWSNTASVNKFAAPSAPGQLRAK